jgi:hypothetical protein
MSTRDIPVHAWPNELDGFTRQHEGWIVTIRVVGADGTSRIAARDLPLRGVSLASPGRHDLVVTVGGAGDHVAHQIPRATSVAIEETSDAVARGLIIDAADGTTSIEFRSPRRPEEVDGLPGYER